MNDNVFDKEIDHARKTYGIHDVKVVCNNSTENRRQIVIIPKGYKLVSTKPAVVTSETVSTFLMGGSFRDGQKHGPDMFDASDYKSSVIGCKRFQVIRKY